MYFLSNKGIPVVLISLVLVLYSISVHANLRIMSYNIKDFWLRFDGELGSIIDEGTVLGRDDFEAWGGIINLLLRLRLSNPCYKELNKFLAFAIMRSEREGD